MEVAEALKNKIMHARLRVGENELYMSDTFDPSSVRQGNNISLSIQIDDTVQLEKLFNSFIGGWHVKMPLEDTFWGARFGMFIDKFGIHWMMNCELKKEPH
jgi:PhnB protein